MRSTKNGWELKKILDYTW